MVQHTPRFSLVSSVSVFLPSSFAALNRTDIYSGIMSSGSSIGSVVWPLLLANLPQRSEPSPSIICLSRFRASAPRVRHNVLTSTVGFGWTCRLIGFMCGILGVVSFFLLKTRLPPKPAGSFFYLEAFHDPQYTLVVSNFVVRPIYPFSCSKRS